MSTTPSSTSRRNLLIGGGLGATGLIAASATPALAAPLAFVPPAHDEGGVDWSLNLDGIPGENTHLGHRGEIQLLAFDWQVKAPSGAGGAGGSSAAGRARSEEISLSFLTSKASPLILQRCLQGRHIATAKITGRKAGEGQQDYIWFDFTEVEVTSFDVAFTLGRPQDVITIAFASVAMTYRPQDEKGALGAPITVSWNLRTNKVG